MAARHVGSPEEALALLKELKAPLRLLGHSQFVCEAAQILVAKLLSLGTKFDATSVLAGAVLHDVGKVLNPSELTAPGTDHERDGQTLLLQLGVDPRIARCCWSHAHWEEADCTIEDLVVALSDKLWKGSRIEELEQLLVAQVAKQTGLESWKVFLTLSEVFEAIAAEGTDRLIRTMQQACY